MSELRASVNLFTNFSSLPSIDAEKDLSELVTGDLNPSHIQVLMHEITHHWSFNSPVGLALSVIYFRNVLDSCSYPSEDVEFNSAFYRRAAKQYLLIELLFPLIEGLAIYCDSDVVPGDEEFSYSAPLVGVGYLLGNRLAAEVLNDEASQGFQNPTHEQISRAMKQILRSERFLAGAADRKMDLYTMQMSPRCNPYLIGYLTLKAVRASQPEGSPLCSNPDRFAKYVRDFFFEDWKLAELILSEPSDVDEQLQDILDHYFERFTHLCEGTHLTDFRSWEDYSPEKRMLSLLDLDRSQGESPYLHEAVPGIGLSDQDAEHGQKALTDAINAFLTGRSDLEYVEQARLLLMSRLQLRSFMLLSTIEIEITVKQYDAGLGFIGRDSHGNPIIAGEVAGRVTPGTYRGLFELFLEPTHFDKGSVVSIEDKVLAVSGSDYMQHVFAQYFDGNYISVTDFTPHSQTLDNMIKEAIDLAKGNEDSWETDGPLGFDHDATMLTLADEWIRSLYGAVLENYWTEEDIEKFLSGGLPALFDDAGAVLSAASRVSVGFPDGLEEFSEDSLKALYVELEADLNKLHSVQSTGVFDFFEQDSGRQLLLL